MCNVIHSIKKMGNKLYDNASNIIFWVLVFVLSFLVGVSFVLFIIGILIEFGLSEDVNCSIIQALSVLY